MIFFPWLASLLFASGLLLQSASLHSAGNASLPMSPDIGSRSIHRREFTQETWEKYVERGEWFLCVLQLSEEGLANVDNGYIKGRRRSQYQNYTTLYENGWTAIKDGADKGISSYGSWRNFFGSIGIDTKDGRQWLHVQSDEYLVGEKLYPGTGATYWNSIVIDMKPDGAVSQSYLQVELMYPPHYCIEIGWEPEVTPDQPLPDLRLWSEVVSLQFRAELKLAFRSRALGTPRLVDPPRIVNFYSIHDVETLTAIGEIEKRVRRIGTYNDNEYLSLDLHSQPEAFKAMLATNVGQLMAWLAIENKNIYGLWTVREFQLFTTPGIDVIVPSEVGVMVAPWMLFGSVVSLTLVALE